MYPTNIYHHKNIVSIFQHSFYHRTENLCIKRFLFANGLNIVFKSKVALSHINMVFPKKHPGEKCLFWEKWEFSTDNLSHTTEKKCRQFKMYKV